MGPNARKNLAKCRSRALLGPGGFLQAVRHLGCWLEVGERSRHNDQAKNYCNYAGLWKSKHVSFQSRRTVFQSVINGAAPSGCEPYVFSTMQWKRLESERMCLLRRAFAREAYNHTDKLRTLSDNTLRRRLSFPTLESAARERRLKWWQSMLAHPSHHTINLATSFGSFEWEKGRRF